ncbi:MAG: ABC transporter ATP-binding protein [Verrucomicrobiia bacterium]
MSNDPVIRVENLSKAYAIWSSPSARLHGPILGQIGQMPFLPTRARDWCNRHSSQSFRNFHALKNVSFTVRRGESFGIIGRNGSGKSTLLQIIAGTLMPTEGEVTVNGSVAALLELGSGFNPEFTGRENVCMNALVLGLSKARINAKFEEIEAFADIGDFIDQPTKTYSSGMLVRLAFAVTTSVDADILLIDEALAVGDIFFRQKCYKHLENLRCKGVTIVLVSHGMADVEQFCQRAAVFDHGRIHFQGSASEAVKRYYLLEQGERIIATGAPRAVEPTSSGPPATGADAEFFWPGSEALRDVSSCTQVSNGVARCTALAVCDAQGRPCQAFEQGQRASFFYEFELLQDIDVPIGGLTIQSDKGMIVHGKSTLEYGTDVPLSVAAGTRLRFQQSISLGLGVGEYTFLVGLATISRADFEQRSLRPHTELSPAVIRLCHLPNVGQFAVIYRRERVPVQLLHHGLANLQGDCRVATVAATVGAAIAPTNRLARV